LEGTSPEGLRDSLLLYWYAIKNWVKKLPEESPEATGIGGGLLIGLSGLAPILTAHFLKGRRQKRMDTVEHQLEEKIVQTFCSSVIS